MEKNNYTCTCPSPFFGNHCQGTKTPPFQLIRKSCFVLVISVACCCSSLYYLDRIIKYNIDRPYIYFHRLGLSDWREQLGTNQLNCSALGESVDNSVSLNFYSPKTQQQYNWYQGRSIAIFVKVETVFNNFSLQMRIRPRHARTLQQQQVDLFFNRNR